MCISSTEVNVTSENCSEIEKDYLRLISTKVLLSCLSKMHSTLLDLQKHPPTLTASSGKEQGEDKNRGDNLEIKYKKKKEKNKKERKKSNESDGENDIEQNSLPHCNNPPADEERSYKDPTSIASHREDKCAPSVTVKSIGECVGIYEHQERFLESLQVQTEFHEATIMNKLRDLGDSFEIITEEHKAMFNELTQIFEKRVQNLLKEHEAMLNELLQMFRTNVRSSLKEHMTTVSN